MLYEQERTVTGFASPGGLLLYSLLGWCVVCDWSEQTGLCSTGPWKGQL